jgi:hypothetical protein
MYNYLRLAAVGAIVATAFSGAANAATVYDTSLASPGVYFGTGNSGENFGWTVNTVNGVELGLTTIHSFVGGLDPTTANIYNVPTGNAGAPHTNRAYWNFDFSVNLQGAGLTIGDVSTALSVKNLGNGLSISGNPLVAFPDTQSYGAGGASPINTNNGFHTTDYAFQNSENPVFGQFASLLFNENANDTYLITLSLSGPNGFIGSVDEFVVAGTGATPLPAALPLFAGGLGVIGFLARRRKSKTAAVLAAA